MKFWTYILHTAEKGCLGFFLWEWAVKIGGGSNAACICIQCCFSFFSLPNGNRHHQIKAIFSWMVLW